MLLLSFSFSSFLQKTQLLVYIQQTYLSSHELIPSVLCFTLYAGYNTPVRCNGHYREVIQSFLPQNYVEQVEIQPPLNIFRMIFFFLFFIHILHLFFQDIYNLTDSDSLSIFVAVKRNIYLIINSEVSEPKKMKMGSLMLFSSLVFRRLKFIVLFDSIQIQNHSL